MTSTTPQSSALADERAKFEAWARDEGMDVGYWLNNAEHGYDNTRVADYWTGWRARSALVQEAVPPTVQGGTLFVFTDEKRFAATKDHP